MELIEEVLAYHNMAGPEELNLPRLLDIHSRVESQIALQEKIDSINRAFCSKNISNVAVAIADTIYKLAAVSHEFGLDREVAEYFFRISHSIMVTEEY